MKMNCQWSQKMEFTAQAGELEVKMDTLPPVGRGSALTPKQLLVAGLCGCTAMDVIALMRKYKQEVTAFSIEAEVSKSEGAHPHVFTEAKLDFRLEGQVDPAKALEAVQLSQTKYCGVSAMLSKAFPIHYVVHVNGTLVGQGSAAFG